MPARHHAGKSGQTGREWEPEEEWAWNESAGEEDSPAPEAPFSGTLPRRRGRMGLPEPWGQKRQTTTSPLCLQPHGLGL